MARAKYVTEEETKTMEYLKSIGKKNEEIAKILNRSITTIDIRLGITKSIDRTTETAKERFVEVCNQYYVKKLNYKQIAKAFEGIYKEKTIKMMVNGYARPYDEWLKEYQKEHPTIVNKGDDKNITFAEMNYDVEIQKGAFDDLVIRQNDQEIYLSSDDVKKIITMYIDGVDEWQ